MSRPRISIITPTLNRGPHLEQTLCSVMDQDGCELEYFVADGGSDDQTMQILELYQDQLSGWARLPGASQAELINWAMQRAEGDLVGFLPGGDLYLPGAIQSLLRAASEQNGDWFISDCLQIDAHDQEVGVLWAGPPASLASLLMHDSGSLPIQGVFLRRELVERHGLFCGHLRYAWDYEYWCRLMAGEQRARLVWERLAAKREPGGRQAADATLRIGQEYIHTAERYAAHLPLRDRYALWRNCDQRRRIYALAEAEMHGSGGRRCLMEHLLNHPWWVADHAVREVLAHGVTHPAAPEMAA